MDLMDYLNNKNYEYKIEKYLEKINKTGVRGSISLKYFVNNIVEPDKSLIGCFKDDLTYKMPARKLFVG